MSDLPVELEISFPELPPLQAAEKVQSLQAYFKAEIPEISLKLRRSDAGAQAGLGDILAVVGPAVAEGVKGFGGGLFSYITHHGAHAAGIAVGYLVLTYFERWLEHNKVRSELKRTDSGEKFVADPKEGKIAERAAKALAVPAPGESTPPTEGGKGHKAT